MSAAEVYQEPKKKAQVAHVEKRANPCAPSHSLIPKASLYERPRAGVDSARIVNDCRNIRASLNVYNVDVEHEVEYDIEVTGKFYKSSLDFFGTSVTATCPTKQVKKWTSADLETGWGPTTDLGCP